MSHQDEVSLDHQDEPVVDHRGDTLSFEGVCVNYRHPDPRRGEPRVGSAPNVAFPVDPRRSAGSGSEFREATKWATVQ